MLRLTYEREKRGWTKTQTAFEAKVHPAALGKYESGKARPYKPDGSRLEAVFGIPIEELLSEVNSVERL